MKGWDEKYEMGKFKIAKFETTLCVKDCILHSQKIDTIIFLAFFICKLDSSHTEIKKIRHDL